MASLANEPKVIKLARDLGLNWRGDCLGLIRDYAMARVETIEKEWPIPITDLDGLRLGVSDKLSVRIELIREDADIGRIAAKYPTFHAFLTQRLMAEFAQDSTEGITLKREAPDPRFFRYLAVVDARGERALRAYFTAWHELAHLLIHPPQLSFPGFRRTPAAAERGKDPIESVVDHIAGRAAFYPRLFEPALRRAIATYGGLNFDALEAARNEAAPTASLFATAMGSIQMIQAPTLFVTVDMALKADEHRHVRGPQQSFDFAMSIEEKLRVTTVVPNDAVTNSPLAIRRNMRVPAQSVLARAHANSIDVSHGAEENQNWWETSRSGRLAPLSMRVDAIRRGRYVYGLITIPRPTCARATRYRSPRAAS